MIRTTLLISLLFFVFDVNAISIYNQNVTDKITQKRYKVVEIIIKGNKITKEVIILRELAIHNGQSIELEELDQLILESRNNLTNINLFNFITIEYELIDTEITIKIEVIERWYVWPYPIFEVSERNFNIWWEDFKSSDY